MFLLCNYATCRHGALVLFLCTCRADHTAGAFFARPAFSAYLVPRTEVSRCCYYSVYTIRRVNASDKQMHFFCFSSVQHFTCRYQGKKLYFSLNQRTYTFGLLERREERSIRLRMQKFFSVPIRCVDPWHAVG